MTFRAMGPRIVIVKKGEHGCLMFDGGQIFAAPAFPLEHVVDPTGAGDSFAGGFMGYLAKTEDCDTTALRQAVVHGSVVASFTCEAFGPKRLAEIGPKEIGDRYQQFRQLVAF